MNKYLLVFIISLFFFSCIGQNKEKTQLSVPQFAKALTDTSIQILDVRTSDEFIEGHIPGSLWADYENKKEFDRRISFLDKSRPIYVYCLTGSRSAGAVKKLLKKGYPKVYELTGGLVAWNHQNEPLEGAGSKKTMTVSEFDSSINSSEIVLVDFGAEWCPPCRKMEPVINNLVSKYGTKFKLLKVDGGNDLNITNKFAVEALPVFIVFKNGKQVWRKDGVAEESEIAAQIN